MSTPSSAAASNLSSSEVELRLEPHRRELTGYCYRMLGSAFDADDAVQETMVRAWRSFDHFEGRAALRSWLHRIATNVCLDMLEGRSKRARPMDLGPVGSAENPVLDTLPEAAWVLPIPDGRVLATTDPAELISSRQTIRLAFVAALQRLPPRQRAVLLLKEVLSWEAAEIAELLGMTVASVNSALQRARATLGRDAQNDVLPPMSEAQQALLGRYVEAFERYDIDTFVSLLHQDATISMPPYALWLRGHAEIRTWLLGPGAPCRGSRLVPTMANGAPAFGQYRASGPGGSFEPWALQVLEISPAGEIVGLCSFLDTPRLFPLFGLPLKPEP